MSTLTITPGTTVVLKGGKHPFSGIVKKIEEDLLYVDTEAGVSFFPCGYEPYEQFRHEGGDLWCRVFPDPMTNEESFSHREPRYTLHFKESSAN